MKKILLLLIVLSLFASFAYAQQEPVVFQEVNVNASIKDAVWLLDGEYVAVVMDDSQNTLKLYDKNSNFITNLGVVGDEGVSQRTYDPNYMLYDERNSLLYWWVRDDDGPGSDFIIKQADLSNIGSLVVSNFKKGDYTSPSGTRYYFTTLMDDTYFYYNKRVNTGPMVTYRARRANNTDVTAMIGDALVTEYNYWRLSDGLYYSSNTNSPYQTYSVEIDGTQITRTLITALWTMDTFNRDINDLRSLSSIGNKIKFGDPLNPSPVPTILGCGNFTAITYPSDDFIFGIDEITGRYAYCDFSNELNPHVFTYVGFNATAPANRYYNDWSDIGAYEYWGSYPDYIYINNVLNDTVQMVVIDGSASETVGNSPPLITHEFLGTDEDRENFVFRLRMSDSDGGQLFYSHKVESFGSGGNTSFFDSINFNDVNDLVVVSNTYCPDSFNISFISPFAPYGTDGLLLTNSSLCLWPTTIDVPDVTGGNTDSVTISTSIGWNYISPSNIQSSSYSIYDINNDLVEQLLFDMDFSNNQLNVSYGNGTLIASDNNLASNRIYTITTNIDFSNDVYTMTMASNLGQLFSVTNSMSKDSVGSVSFNEYTSSDLLTYVDFVSVDYDITSNDFPPYVSFGLLGAGDSEQKDIYYTIPSSGFGDYESYAYGTDQTIGTSVYQDPHYITFTYNENTPALTQEQIDSIIGGDDFVEGDLSTDLLPNILDSVGIRTQTSKFVVGLVILIIVLVVLASYSTLVALFGGAATMIILSLPAIGLWPVWSLAILVVVAAGIVAVGFRKITSGG